MWNEEQLDERYDDSPIEEGWADEGPMGFWETGKTAYDLEKLEWTPGAERVPELRQKEIKQQVLKDYRDYRRQQNDDPSGEITLPDHGLANLPKYTSVVGESDDGPIYETDIEWFFKDHPEMAEKYRGSMDFIKEDIQKEAAELREKLQDSEHPVASLMGTMGAHLTDPETATLTAASMLLPGLSAASLGGKLLFMALEGATSEAMLAGGKLDYAEEMGFDKGEEDVIIDVIAGGVIPPGLYLLGKGAVKVLQVSTRKLGQALIDSPTATDDQKIVASIFINAPEDETVGETLQKMAKGELEVDLTPISEQTQQKAIDLSKKTGKAVSQDDLHQLEMVHKATPVTKETPEATLTEPVVTQRKVDLPDPERDPLIIEDIDSIDILNDLDTEAERIANEADVHDNVDPQEAVEILQRAETTEELVEGLGVVEEEAERILEVKKFHYQRIISSATGEELDTLEAFHVARELRRQIDDEIDLGEDLANTPVGDSPVAEAPVDTTSGPRIPFHPEVDNANDLLEMISASGGEDGKIAQLILSQQPIVEKLKKVGVWESRGNNSFYWKGHIYLTGPESHKVVHEAIHAVTIEEMIANPKFYEEVEGLMGQFEEYLTDTLGIPKERLEVIKGLETADEFENFIVMSGEMELVENYQLLYAMRNPYEFLGQTFGNKETRDALASIKLKEPLKIDENLTLSTIWDVFVNTIRKSLGLTTEDHTLLDAALMKGIEIGTVGENKGLAKRGRMRGTRAAEAPVDDSERLIRSVDLNDSHAVANLLSDPDKVKKLRELFDRDVLNPRRQKVDTAVLFSEPAVKASQELNSNLETSYTEIQNKRPDPEAKKEMDTINKSEEEIEAFTKCIGGK